MGLPPLDTSAYLKSLVEGSDPDGLTLLGIPGGVRPSRAQAAARVGEIEILWKNPRNQRGAVGSRLKTLKPRLAEVKRAVEDDEAFRALLESSGRARAAREHGAKKKLREVVEGLERAIAELAASGRTASAADLERWSRFCHDRGVPGEELDRLLRDHGVRRAPAGAEDEPYERARRLQIRRNLHVFEELAREASCASLYKYLEITADQQDDERLDRAISQRLDRKRKAAEEREPGDLKTAMSRLNGACQELCTAAGRRRYDASRLEDFKEEIVPELERVSLATGGVAVEEVAGLVARGRRHYLTDAAAREAVLDKARNMEISVEVPPPQRGRLLRCARCDLDQPEAPACLDCGAPLHRSCPSCGAGGQAVGSICGGCGTNLLLRTRSETELAQARAALDAGAVSEAGALVRALRASDPDYADAQALERDVAGRADEAARAWATYDAQLERRELFGARATLAHIRRLSVDLPSPDGRTAASALAGLEERLAAVERELAVGRSAEEGEAIPREIGLVRALELAADCAEARAALSTTPPAPPGSVRAHPGPSSVELRWSPSRSPGAVDYVVVRGDRTAPRTPGAGVVAAETGATELADDGAPPGSVCAWSVFARRAGALSMPASSEAVSFAPEVRELRAEAGDGAVALRWRPEVGTAEILVQRSGPEGESFEIEVPAGRAGVVDRDVENGVLYTYSVAARYPDGRLTDGVRAAARPVGRPEPVRDLRATAIPGAVRLDWTSPADGAVRVYRLASQPPAPGAELDPRQLDSLGTALRSSLDTAEDRDAGTASWYVPVTSAGQYHVAGPAALHVAAPAISDLEVSDLRTELHVSWVWPDGVDEAAVLWRSDAPPSGAGDHAARRLEVARATYQLRGCRIPCDPEEDLHVLVCTGVRIEGELHFGEAGHSARRSLTRAAERVLRYEVVRTRGLRPQVVVRFDADSEGKLPDLVVVQGDGVMPTSPDSAAIELGRLGPGAAAAGPALEIPLSRLRRPAFIRAFLADPEDRRRYRLVDPPVAARRIA